MRKCAKCGKSYEDGNVNCPYCGEMFEANEEKTEEKKNKFFNDSEANSTNNDIVSGDNDVAMAVISYIWWLVLIPLLLGNKSKFVKFHMNQGFVIAILSTVLSVVLGILTAIPVIGVLAVILLSLVDILFLCLMVAGIIQAAQKKMIKFPIIGSFTIIK